MIDVVCFHADLGHTEYRELIQRAFRNAKMLMDCRTVILTPEPKHWMTGMADKVATYRHPEFPEPTTPDNLCLTLAMAYAAWGTHAERNTVFIGPDIEFLSAPTFGDWDIGLMWRHWKPDQPINNGVVLATPGNEKFWLHYSNVVINLPKKVHGWACDQIALALMTGVCRQPGETLVLDDARVRLFEASEHCDIPEHAKPSAWALNHSGIRKGAFFRNVSDHYKQVA